MTRVADETKTKHRLPDNSLAEHNHLSLTTNKPLYIKSSLKVHNCHRSEAIYDISQSSSAKTETNRSRLMTSVFCDVTTIGL